jgi:phosphate uptake regulator
MLKEIIALWKGETFMKKVVREFGGMLSDDEYLCTHAWEAFLGRIDIEQIKQPFYDKDISVNKREREIRRMIAEHLSIHPRQDISGCLAMMSLVKDAERIGDHSKNIFEIAIVLQGVFEEMKYLERLSSIQKRIADRFPLLKRAFLESDEDAAKKILNDYGAIKAECNKILSDLLSEEMPTREAVATTLMSRYLKRINSHMSNIASGLVYPLDQIDFVRGGILE